MKHLITALALAGIAGSSLAANAPVLPDALLACGNIQDAVERAHCYDTQIAALKKAPATKQAGPAPGAVAAATPQAPASPARPAQTASATGTLAGAAAEAPTTSQARNFGKEDLPPERRPEAPKQDTVMEAKISGNRSVGPNIWLISLDNGQVWRQEGNPTTMFFKAGDTVKLEKGTLGQYRMTSANLKSKNWLQVTRVK